MVNVVLTGMRGTGKSSIGAVLAERLGFAFIDTDAAIEELAGCRIAEIVVRHGWNHFRALERQVVARTLPTDRQVIAAGGGTLIDEENAVRLKERGLVFATFTIRRVWRKPIPDFGTISTTLAYASRRCKW